jgi:hypothetical protein
MPLEIWTEQSNYSFGTIAERTALDFQLPVAPLGQPLKL